MSAAHLAIGDMVKCLKCHQWHPAEHPERGKSTEYAAHMLYIRCGALWYYAGQEGLLARDPARVRSGNSSHA
jgi:hypothetical protein